MALILTYASSASLNLHLHKFTPKFLISQYVLLEVTRCSITIPITNPQAYPINTTFQPNPSPNDDSCLISKVGISLFSHFFDNWKPHNPKFPSKDELWNVQNCPPCGIGPISWFWERFKYFRNVRLVSCWGILPKRRFQERSKDSSAISVVKF